MFSQFLYSRNQLTSSKTLKLRNLGSVSKSQSRKVIRQQRIENILERVTRRDGIHRTYPHIQYLIGRTAQGGESASNGGSLDIGDKTQLILQSSHPVRRILEREIINLSSSYVNVPNQLNYHDWIIIFGRSLRNYNDNDTNTLFESQLDNIANAAESGMFSSDIHQTVISIPSDPFLHQLSTDRIAELNLGNKYAVLVGDYFAIKAIFFAEKAKSSQVILSITRGVEDFASAPFSSKLVDPKIWARLTPSIDANVDDWVEYNVRAAGYFTGACNAVLNVLPSGMQRDVGSPQLKISKVVKNLALFLKIMVELDDLYEHHHGVSPFFLTSLPGVLFQKSHSNAYSALRHMEMNSPNVSDELAHLHEAILQNDAVLDETIDFMKFYSHLAKRELSMIASTDFYVSIFNEIINVIIESLNK